MSISQLYKVSFKTKLQIVYLLTYQILCADAICLGKSEPWLDVQTQKRKGSKEVRIKCR